MKRTLILSYGGVCYLVFLFTFLFAIWFVYTLDRPALETRPVIEALVIDAVLLALFASQHSIMARQWFKRAWTRVIPREAERSTFVLMASFALLLIFGFWHPVTSQIWTVQSVAGESILRH